MPPLPRARGPHSSVPPQELNTDDSLYRALRGVIGDAEAMRGFTEEQRRVVQLHVAEFERGGIHLVGEDRCDMSPPPLLFVVGCCWKFVCLAFFLELNWFAVDRVGQLDALLVELSPLVMRHLFASSYDFFFSFIFVVARPHGSR